MNNENILQKGKKILLKLEINGQILQYTGEILEISEDFILLKDKFSKVMFLPFSKIISGEMLDFSIESEKEGS